MKKHYACFVIVAIFMFVGFALQGCSRPKQEGKRVAQINNYNMTEEDFKNELRFLGYDGVLIDPKAVLDVAIDRQLLIQEAQRMGLHKQKTFLEAIERYWEQTLIKELMDKETMRITKSVAPEEREKELQKWISGLRTQANIIINQELVDGIIKQRSTENK